MKVRDEFNCITMENVALKDTSFKKSHRLRDSQCTFHSWLYTPGKLIYVHRHGQEILL